MTQSTSVLPRRAAFVAVLVLLALVASAVMAARDTSGPTSSAVRSAQEDGSGTDAGDEPDETPDIQELPVQSYQVFLARDPFSPLTPPEGAGDGGDGATDGTDGGTDGDGTTSPTTTVLSSIATQDVFEDEDGVTRAILEIDGTLFTVGVGDVLSAAVRIRVDGSESFTDLEVTAIDDPCVTAVVAGQSTVYCIGEAPSDGDGDVTVALIDVFVDPDTGEERALIQVDSTLYEVGEGQEFATNYRVLSIDPPCVTILRGDEALTLCEGDRVLK